MSQHNHVWYEQEIQDLWSSRISPPQRLSISKEGMVAAQHYLATEGRITDIGKWRQCH
jgi:hypothetical protein